MNKLKQILSNKNTVTFIGMVLIVIVLMFFYQIRVNQAISLVAVPCATKDINPRTKLTNEMITTCEYASSSLKGNVVSKKEKLVGLYTNTNAFIPSGSIFYGSQVLEQKDLPDAYLVEVPEGEVAYNFSVNTSTTYGNSMYPGNYVDVYFKGTKDGKLMLGKLVENVKILAVKDSSGAHVFEAEAGERTPSQIIFSVSKEINLLLRKAEYISGAKVILVPSTSTINLNEEEEKVQTYITSDTIKTYIEEQSVFVDEIDNSDSDVEDEIED